MAEKSASINLFYSLGLAHRRLVHNPTAVLGPTLFMCRHLLSFSFLSLRQFLKPKYRYKINDVNLLLFILIFGGLVYGLSSYNKDTI
jgi:hypothetical protein